MQPDKILVCRSSSNVPAYAMLIAVGIVMERHSQKLWNLKVTDTDFFVLRQEDTGYGKHLTVDVYRNEFSLRFDVKELF